MSLSGSGGGLAAPERLTHRFSLEAGLPFIGVRERPVAGDMDGDGFDDLGLWVPDRSGAASQEMGEWYFLVSHGQSIVERIVGPQRNGTIKFTPTPFAHDIFAQFGDEFGVPIVGNFDPPTVQGGPIDQANAIPPAQQSTTSRTTASTGSSSDLSTALDVNNDQYVSPLDRLLVLNELNRGAARQISDAPADLQRLDVNGDGFLSPLDALLVLNEINRLASLSSTAVSDNSNQAVLSATASAREVDEVFAVDDLVESDRLSSIANALEASNAVVGLNGATERATRVVRPGRAVAVPRAPDRTVEISEGQPAVLDVLRSLKGSAASRWKVRMLSPPTNGQVVREAWGVFRYVPNDGFIGEDTFMYYVEDGRHRRASGLISVNVRGV